MDKPVLVKAKDLPSRCCFRKRTGYFSYIRMSEGSVKFLGLKPDKIYGIAYHGNVAIIEPETLVVEMSLNGLMEDLGSEQAWDNTFAKNGATPVKETEKEMIRRYLVEAMGADVCEGSGLAELVAVLISQRDNARNGEEEWKRRAEAK